MRNHANSEVEDGPVADELLPCNEVPECDTICHDTEENDKNEGEEGRCCPDVERHDGVNSNFVFVVAEENKKNDGGD